MVRSRVSGILAGCEDQSDHDTLRHDPVLKLLAYRSADNSDLANQPTRSRLENTSSIPSPTRLRDELLYRMFASFDTRPITRRSTSLWSMTWPPASSS
jgi:hypothetical protein